MSTVQINGLHKRYGNVEILKNINLDIKSGEFMVFVGPSGCGKSTLLRCIAGLETISDGTLSIDGEVVNLRAPSRRGIAMVFQSYALYPHMSVFDNMAYALKLQKLSKDEIKKKVGAAADTLQLTPYLDRLPKQLSGGQRQRVAIGRAIVRNPKVFLFDEPLSNLDAALRVATRIEINKLHERMAKTTMIYVTHDQVEAMTLADRIVVLSAGRIEQVGSPMELYERPANLFVARFIGSPAMNTVPCIIEEGGANARVRPVGHNAVRVAEAIPASAAGQKGTFGVRPEDLTLTQGTDAIFKGRVEIVEHLGELTLLYVDCGNPDEPVLAKLPGNAMVKRGDEVSLTAPISTLHVFDDKGVAFPRKG
ncbi:MAG: sn-glycerol-3-phosphate ABC transporter ATP-binding protein UgpC [Bauldia sp.]